MTTRAADDADFISARLAQFDAQRIAREAARARGCHERQDGQPLCAFSDCPFCRPERWEAPLPSAEPVVMFAWHGGKWVTFPAAWLLR